MFAKDLVQPSSNMEMETAPFSKLAGHIYQTTLHHTPEWSNR